ncbi:MAG TPA: hydrogenase maturation nickel metallochaperone HypA [Polyangiaceae bacterium]
MHELALVQSVVDAVTERVGHRRVVRVRLRVGTLVAVVPDAMRFCFDAATASTPLEGALLEIEPVAARARCGECDEVFTMGDGLPLCACGSVDVTILAGRELVIQDVEVG